MESVYSWLESKGRVEQNRITFWKKTKQNNKTPNLSFSQLLMNTAFMGQYCLTRRHVATVAISREKVWSKKEKHQCWKTLSRWILQFKHNTTGKSFSNTVLLTNCFHSEGVHYHLESSHFHRLPKFSPTYYTALLYTLSWTSSRYTERLDVAQRNTVIQHVTV